MRIKYLFLTISAYIITFANVATTSAWANDQRYDMKINNREILNYERVTANYTELYDTLVEEVMRDGNADFAKVRTLRTYYPNTQYYTPFSENLIKRMTAFAYIADTAANLTEVNDALAEYRALLTQNIANFDVLTFALTLARADVRYGDEILLNDMRKLMIQDITNIHDVGKTPEKAYKIVTYGEETFVLEQLNAKVLESEVFQVSRSLFNVHEIETLDGEVEQIYMNVTSPLRNLKIRQIFNEQRERRTIQ